MTRERRRIVRLGDSELELEVIRQERRWPCASPRTAPTCSSCNRDWKPGDPVWAGLIDGNEIACRCGRAPNGFLLMHRGVRTRAHVYTEREAVLARLMLAKVATDSGKEVRCPMPGLVMSIAVAAGQEVKTGDTLAVVEAMKMENVLRAERDGTVKKIHVKPGDSVAVDAVILEFA